MESIQTADSAETITHGITDTLETMKRYFDAGLTNVSAERYYDLDSDRKPEDRFFRWKVKGFRELQAK